MCVVVKAIGTSVDLHSCYESEKDEKKYLFSFGSMTSGLSNSTTRPDGVQAMSDG